MSRVLNDDEQRTADTALWLFRAFVSGVGSNDLQRGAKTPAEVDEWKAHAIKMFEETLKEMLQ